MRMQNRSWMPLILVAVTLAGCDPADWEAGVDEASAGAVLDAVAEDYVKLVLAVGQHDADYVDAYYGPEEWRTEAEARILALEEIHGRADEMIRRIAAAEVPASDEMLGLRQRYLERQIEALIARVEMLAGESRSFDEESQALYDAVAPTRDEGHYQAVIYELEGLLAAEGLTEGPFIDRYETFRADFAIPPEKLDAVFQAAIEACRERTAGHIELPPGESFTVEYVTDKPWSGYNWYQGGYRSLIQVNTDLPIYIDRAVDLACHEGYPGHHLYNALLEKHLMRDRGWVEMSVYPLFSPQSLIAEGSANYGIDMAFPGDQRWRYEAEVLFPLAGLDADRAAAYYRIQEQVAKLSYAGNEAARRYLDGDIDADAAAEWLARFAAMEPARARQRVSFIDKYRSYVINYNLGKDLVRCHVEARAGDDETRRWQVFEELLSTPRLPSDLDKCQDG
ncbi:MAG: hypothetical protein V3T72_21200 [Thermoanaerobaculia bacterium]